MIVELIGLPASGKTTISTEIFREEENVVYPLNNLYKKSWLVRNLFKAFSIVSFICIHPTRTFRLIELIIQSHQKNKSDYLRLILNNLFIFKIISRYKSHSKVVLFDEGLLHHAWGIQIGAKKEFDYETYLKLAEYETTKIIYISCDTNSLIRRMNERGKLSRRHYEISKNIDSNRAIIEKMLINVKIDHLLNVNNSNLDSVQDCLTNIKCFIKT